MMVLPGRKTMATLSPPQDLIDEIRRYNTSVQPVFLAQFDEPALKQYLQHLQSAARKHVQISGWVRRQPKLRLAS